MGVSYKEDVADTRLSPSEIFYKEATKLGAKIFVHDQMVKYWSQLGIKVMQKIPKINTFDAVIFAVRHDAYSKINFDKWIENTKSILIFDANKVLKNNQIKAIQKKSIYMSIGRG